MADIEGMRKLLLKCEENLRAKGWYDVPSLKKRKPSEDNLERNDTYYKVKKTESKLVRNEGRLFLERTVYLNKSTTKYAIIGVHPITFRSIMKICDRSSGSYFDVTSGQYLYFMRRVKTLLDENFEVDNPVFVDDSRDHVFAFTPLSQDVWRIESEDGPGAALHRISLENLIRFDAYVMADLVQRETWAIDCEKEMEEIRFATVDFAESKILEYIDTISKKSEYGSLNHQLALDLIINREYLLTLQEYNDGFFRRVKSL